MATVSQVPSPFKNLLASPVVEVTTPAVSTPANFLALITTAPVVGVISKDSFKVVAAAIAPPWVNVTELTPPPGLLEL